MTVTETVGAPKYPFGPVVRLDLHPRYLELCRHEPVSRVTMPYGGEAWLLTGYHEIKQFLADPRFSSHAATEPDTARVTPLPLRPGNLLSMDPPDHGRIRKVVAHAFRPRIVSQLAERMRDLVESELDAMEEAGPPGDLVQRLAIPLPVRMIVELFGVPYEERAEFRRYSDVFVATSAHTKEEINEARDGLEDFLRRLIAKRRSSPSDDLISVLIEALDAGQLSEVEAVRTGIGVLMAGHETSLSMISNVSFLLLAQRELYTQLCEDRNLLDPAIEEMLRIIPLRSVGSFPRRASEDVEIGGKLIREGDTVIFQRAAGDRDERVFEDPDTIRFDRERNPHLGFGHGMHFCLGASLARAELKVALEGLMARFPTLRLTGTADDVPWKPGLIARAPESLLVEW
ncbi:MULTISPECIES: cytochrome P450 [Streptomyces]|uniref:Cytochrome n=2 Tax=Streptomyces TaxID=1883 RepID=A0A100Y462_9ACTN|nr:MULTISPECIES: cytochrome P450 [Streptomyces]KUH37390.1 cytochrome [Streptomyces kanasensis]UUS31619.1 cytochrome P450 [Streptomyces changanensis]